ncbi:MAG: hypothetical protein A3B74_05260 [Candidatus Kerfeldbacteria bacterium RIFCSPHIGHO2_02_FULL_42_14]|uniref:YoaR-like putative peptidoglycan binding domain-containing protein n=1 Tax=Candidatus Kerfeldbacteria bacterium RIFCSPHIGHO2_02_FULL_42_14 TaxID=1798540 RepID=A0A1G2AT02_9BACT|nr:MAG: hypothetical protein A3B74_05260 [Candidatus Kerfeldbacteria bacterium RIFCSPHIGHO2_02_FULL_42_14]OGY81595.1 MAG: hypothetical protein A3E60_01985 [Candidatus Kerfeldbacteria bacterium RIFCSPHIGHO2_12_FULL_42_13]OGY83198.1 MAG: hypothetical protein A3I91_03395 [Candidatus Kerfeldbacteria bacterium RIFCSPLOWO2_02_FULL_42_19]OGY86249.1 MAG: hypothetical protein A3G01_00225 [Candidatus Kerfeldbacteria bacterium RIFCSPLOWO2_12_FULL_43_9]
MTAKKDRQHSRKFHIWLGTRILICVAICIVIALIIATAYFIFFQNYQQKIFPGVQVADYQLTGFTAKEALEMLEVPTEIIQTQGLKYQWQDYQVAVTPTIGGADEGSFSYDFITFDLNTTVAHAYAVGRKGTWSQNIQEQLQSLLFRKAIPLEYTMDQKELVNILTENFQEFEQPAKDAQLIFVDHEARVQEEFIGKTFDYPALVMTTNEHLQDLNTEPIFLSYIDDAPRIKTNEAKELLTEAQTLVTLAPLTLHHEDRSWSITQDNLEKALAFRYNSNAEISLTLDSVFFRDYLQNIAKEVYVSAKEGKFEIRDGTMVQIQESQLGKEVDIEASLEKISQVVTQEKQSDIQLVMKETKPKVTAENVDDLGIVEKIGEGRSNFAGSPRNRILNIKHGASKLHGILIAPEEEFSLVRALQPFTLEDGWLPELVIKGNKTVPEIGGGGCQLGTTTFRATMGSGLPVTERRSHSYAVSYYFEKFDAGKAVPGTDATIYEPSPDFRFVNDTGNYILFQTRVEGTELIFEFWGKNDGRTSARTKPVISNWTAPPPRKEIPTPDLAPGEVNCIEKPHAGLNATFDYFVTLTNGETRKQTFDSRYKAWQEVCLVGVTPAEKPQSQSQETPKNNNNNTNKNQNNNAKKQ